MKISIALAVVALGAAGCAKHEAYEKPLVPVRVQQVNYASGATSLRYSASIEPKTRVDLAFKAGGYVEELAAIGGRTIQDGDRVTRGMVLARVRAADYLEKVNQARSQLAEAEAALAATKPAFDRASILFEQKSLSRPDFEQAQAAYSTVQAKLAGARALVQEAENARADTALTSPINGIVLKRLVEVGSLVGPGTGGFVVADVSSVKAMFGAPDTLLHVLKVGASAPVMSEAVPGRQFSGRITNIAPTADPRSRVFDVELTIPNPDAALKIGMVAVVQIARGERTSAPLPLVVPLTAIVRSPDKPGGYAVYVIESAAGKTIARVRNVTLGDLIGNQVAIVDGVRTGDRIVVSGSTIVTDGQAVSITL